MEPWMLWVFSLYGVLHGQDHPASPKVEDCCYDGRHRALGGEDCTVLPLIASSHICRIAQEQCCSAAAGNTLCTTGINLAKEQGACVVPFTQEDPFETKTTKMCCDCCLLGLMSASRGYGCELALDMGKRCRETAQACCGGVQPGHNNTVAGTLAKTDLNHSPGDLLAHQCKVGSTKCSHLCVGKDTCACFDGYHLQPDQHTCEDINECLNGSHNCGAGQSCINTEGSYRCQRDTNCGTGYELTDANICLDIDECALGTHNCGGDFECRNREGSFRCLPRVPCGEGYIQDAVGTCIDINECLTQSSPCQPGQTCINTVGSYNCRRYSVICGHGYHLSGDGSHCVDVNECLLEEACQGHDCVNLLGSFRCECRPGFTFHSVIRLCEDINECRHYSGRLCAHKCDNTPGSYQCSCTTGFKLASDGRNCEDVNECENNPCSQECANVYGSYQCYCRRGYHLSDVDGINCEDIDECALPTGGHVCSYRCSNTPGSFHCTCPLMGYTLAPNGRTCQDMDECATGSHSCKAAEVCVNIQGGFRCLSFECPPNYRRAAEGHRSVSSVNVRCIKSCKPSDIGCVLDPSHSISHTVVSLPTFRDFTGPEEVVFLKTMAPSNPSPFSQSADVFFDILATDNKFSFDVVKRSQNDMIMGVVRQVKPITGPQNVMLELAMNYVKGGIVSHRNIVVVHIFISEFWF
ncbi:fibulin-1 isoform X1 [Esox lucius]|uniref:fibulin-1 isoform X1 n=1 Tax=Esox lucius TaxID=8010 RepID=UPI0014777815|nr:fibulin-1 isoform X1 [Esox lucius]